MSEALAEPGVIRLKLPRPHPGQIRVIAEAAHRNVTLCGRGWGKTRLGVDRGIDGMLRELPVGWFAPTYKILADAWRVLKRLTAPVTVDKSETEHRLVLATGGSVECWSLENPDAGRSRRYGRVIIDEAGMIADLDTIWEESIRPTLSQHRGDAWFLGTPKGRRRFFWHLFQRGMKGDAGWKSWQLPSIENPYLSREDIEEARLEMCATEMGRKRFEQEYLGIPMEDEGNPFGFDAIRACAQPQSLEEPAVWGWDLAKSVDYTVGYALDRYGRWCRMIRIQKPWNETEQVILDAIGNCPTLIDSTGVGDPIVERLQQKRPMRIEGFKFTGQSKQQLMEGLASALQRQALSFEDGVTRIELEAFEYEYRKTGVSYSAPSGLHDDCVCALALAWRMFESKFGRAPLVLPGVSATLDGKALEQKMAEVEARREARIKAILDAKKAQGTGESDVEE